MCGNEQNKFTLSLTIVNRKARCSSDNSVGSTFCSTRVKRRTCGRMSYAGTLALAKKIGLAKSTAILELLKCGHTDPNWTLPSRIADHPLTWLIQVNSIIVDARYASREIQEEAFRCGWIPCSLSALSVFHGTRIGARPQIKKNKCILPIMLRSPLSRFSNALYHITWRGDRSENIYKRGDDRLRF
ncbi:hypothetical protein SAMN05421863_11443 [Nitrosomonas communis]|uniref:Uncharacterized protein n=1 Tax=Nitrosomonas communis TaxID=44574 RepID=A0A1I4X9A4_9PROT|nr:hypothetical protein SAMN05421863_11443 [Nitrosomonas communis]